VRRFERNLICNALVRAGGRQRRAAKLLGLKVTTLNAKIKRHGIDWESARMTDGGSDAAGLPLLKMVA
jgi:transcriptional regulator with GAF, ATPase, and Fis domain